MADLKTEKVRVQFDRVESRLLSQVKAMRPEYADMTYSHTLKGRVSN